MINIVIPMAGAGSRFAAAGFKKPKPFIDVAGKPMIERVLRNLSVPDARFVLVIQESHLLSEPLVCESLARDFSVTYIPIKGLTEGSACTVLMAGDKVDPELPMLIANSDQLVDSSINDFIEDAKSRSLDGSILTFEDMDRDPKWSFAKVGETGLVEEVREKDPFSPYATVGIYYFKKAEYFFDAAARMIKSEDRVNNEFYTCPTYNYLIRNRRRVGTFNITKSQMHGLGTPEDLNLYLKRSEKMEVSRFKGKDSLIE